MKKEVNVETAKKYPYIFNLFIDYRYIDEKNYDLVNELLKESIENKGGKIPVVLESKLFFADADVDLIQSSIKNLPKDLKVGGSLLLQNCKKLKSLPEGLEVKGNLLLSESAIEILPENLKVGGFLYLRNCVSLKILPPGLEVNGNLILSGSSVTSLPNDLKVGGVIER